jgi:aspartate/methionine/tyrosine aminotransferase
MPQEAIEAILRFAAVRGVLVMADEVYQENV